MKKLILCGIFSALISLGSMSGLSAQASVEPGGVTCPSYGQVGGNCHITIQRYKQTQYGVGLCDYCEWTGYPVDYCDPLSHGGCMSV